MDDRRRSPRKPLSAEVEYESGGVRVVSRIADIGTLGIYIETPSPPPVGAHLKITFTLPSGHLIEIEGRVAHRQTGIGMGVAFISLSTEGLEHIQRFVDAE